MAKIKEMTVDELEQFIEHKVVEILGDPDAGLALKPAFRKKLESILKKSSKMTSHQEVVKRLG
ncbi:MAG: hypothetical protein A2V67_10950 [Deltaproteobacteria bacterium RBG_13_61_14]|nr:MAG: hypothetical protein A2V67_10950 [Deltaproteobacteria bacterium RBG_13_61_14]